MRKVVMGVIFFYQRTLSPDHGVLAGFYPYGFCQFYPSCSEYARMAVDKMGFLRGVSKTLTRLARCNPWSRGGIDLV